MIKHDSTKPICIHLLANISIYIIYLIMNTFLGDKIYILQNKISLISILLSIYVVVLYLFLSKLILKNIGKYNLLVGLFITFDVNLIIAILYLFLKNSAALWYIPALFYNLYNGIGLMSIIDIIEKLSSINTFIIYFCVSIIPLILMFLGTFIPNFNLKTTIKLKL